MNRENLNKIADYIETIPKEKFGMWFYRIGQKETHECDSVGCVLGHSTVLDAEPLPLLPSNYGISEIDFTAWSERFTGLSNLSHEWTWCFSSTWENTDNTPTGAAKRIRWMLENGLPEHWSLQMYGTEPLCYE